MQMSSPMVLHVPFNYFPDSPGGTEIYVASLIVKLRELGISGAVAAPGIVSEFYEHDGIIVYRFAHANQSKLMHAYGEPDQTAARSFRAVLSHAKPQIVHLHAHTSAVSDLLVDAGHECGAKIVFTYHTPTVSCVQGTMMRLGHIPCDGELIVRRCAACVLAKHGVPPLFRETLAALSPVVGDKIGHFASEGKFVTALCMSSLVSNAHKRFNNLMEKADRVVAVCNWVADVLRINGVPDDKVMLCRQGLPDLQDQTATLERLTSADSVLQLGYFGRIDPVKGIDILIDALRSVPKLPVSLKIYGVRQPGSEDYARKLEQSAASDARITFWSALSPGAVESAMRACHFVAIPSRWQETGPLVVLEAFGAGTPVLGAQLGGISELVEDGVDGILIPPDDSAAWARTITSLAKNLDRVQNLRKGVRKPRSMRDAAIEMAALYHTLLTG